MPNPERRQLFQSAMQVLIPGVLALLNALMALGGFPTQEELYMAVLGALMSGILAAAALFGVSKMQVGGVEAEAKIVRALHSNPETGKLLPGTTARELAKPAPESLK